MTEVEFLTKLIKEVREEMKSDTLSESKEAQPKSEEQELREHLAREVVKYFKDSKD